MVGGTENNQVKGAAEEMRMIETMTATETAIATDMATVTAR